MSHEKLGPMAQKQQAIATPSNRFQVGDKEREQYRRTFSGQMGVAVLSDILSNMCVFDIITCEEQASKRNAGIEILVKAGVIKIGPDGKVCNMQAITGALLSLADEADTKED